MLLQQGEEKGKGHLVNISKKLALLVDSNDLQFCIIGSPLYKSAILRSTFLRMWYISKKFHLNVTLKACCAEDHSKCQNSLMRPMTEFRISLCHIFLKLISKTKLCIWNLICAIIQFPYLQKCRLFSVYLSFQGSMCLERAMRIVTVEYVPPSFFERINLNHGCILDFYLCTVTNSATERKVYFVSSTVHRTEHRDTKKLDPYGSHNTETDTIFKHQRGEGSDWNSLDL